MLHPNHAFFLPNLFWNLKTLTSSAFHTNLHPDPSLVVVATNVDHDLPRSLLASISAVGQFFPYVIER